MFYMRLRTPLPVTFITDAGLYILIMMPSSMNFFSNNGVQKIVFYYACTAVLPVLLKNIFAIIMFLVETTDGLLYYLNIYPTEKHLVTIALRLL